MNHSALLQGVAVLPRRVITLWLGLAVLAGLAAMPASALSPMRRPIMVAPAASLPIQMREVKITTSIAGALAETRVEMVFFNPNNRQLEGELQFPLMEGQEVTGFALDINGVMRDAVPVEKARAQAVFEEITRRQVDPGLLQVTQGNNYKLRVYPIFPRNERRVTIRYVETLAYQNGRVHYRLPLEYPDAVQSFEFRMMVSGASGLPVAQGPQAGLPFTRHADIHEAQFTRRNFIGKGMLEVAIPAARQLIAYTQTLDGQTYFRAEIPLTQPAGLRPIARDVTLVWDSSASGAARDYARELALLQAYFQQVRDTRVQLVRVRDQVEAPQLFNVSGGDWQALRETLERTVYDGATNLGAVNFNDAAGEVLLFSDGLSNYGAGTIKPGAAPVFAVSSSAQADLAALARLARASGGQAIDLLAESADAAVRKLTGAAWQIAALDGTGVTRTLGELRAGGTVVTGLLTRDAGTVTLRLRGPGGSGARQQVFTVPVQAGRYPAAQAAPAWARMQINALEGEYALNRGEIRRLGTQFGLVTRETSLIVLEIVADYARFEIVPPPELREEYERLVASGVARREADNQAHLNQVAARYQQRIIWWEREFPKGRRPAPVVERGRPHLKAETATIGIRGMDSDQTETRTRLGSAQQGPVPRPAVSPPAKMAVAPPAKPAAKPMPLHRWADEAAVPAQSAQRELLPLPGVTLAGNTVKREVWRSDSAAAQRLREAAPGDLYRIYLDERPGYSHDARYFADVAELLLRAGQTELALRVLSNLAEMDLENRHNLRQHAMRLQLAGRNDLAIPLLERVRDLAPEEPQSHRDLALALAERGEHQRAVDLLYHVAERRWDARFPDIGVIAAVDMNAVIATATASGKTLETARIDARLRRHLPLDVRVVLTWDADNTNIDLVMTDPNERLQRYGFPSYQGGQLSMNYTGGYGPEEYALKNAKPGKYRIEARHSGHRQQVSRPIDPTVLVRVQSAFSTPQQQEKLYSVRLSRVGESRFIGELEIPGVAEEHR